MVTCSRHRWKRFGSRAYFAYYLYTPGLSCCWIQYCSAVQCGGVACSTANQIFHINFPIVHSISWFILIYSQWLLLRSVWRRKREKGRVKSEGRRGGWLVCIEVLVGSGVSIPTSTTITIESRVESSGTIVFLLPSYNCPLSRSLSLSLSTVCVTLPLWLWICSKN